MSVKETNFQALKKSRDNGLCILINSPEVQEIRNKYDKLSEVYPSHIRLIFPFVTSDKFDDFETLITQIVEENKITEFDLTLERFDSFFQKTDHTLVIRPDQESKQILTDLYSKIMPHIDTQIKRKFSPRVICGKIHRNRIPNLLPKKQRKKIKKINIKHQKQEIVDTLQQLQTDWQPITVRIDELVFLERSGDKVSIVKKIPLIKN